MSRTIRKNRFTGRPERDTYWRRNRSAFSCRSHGGCPWCLGNRMHKNRVKPQAFPDEALPVVP